MNPTPLAGSSEEDVNFKGLVDCSQFRQVQSLLLPWWANPYFFAACVTYLMVSFGVGWETALSKPARAIPDFVTVAFIVVLYLGLKFFSVSRAWKMYSKLHGAISGSVGDDCIEWKTTITSSKFTWDKILKVKQAPDLALVFYAPRCALFFPRSFFTSEIEWQRFNAIVEKNAPSGRTTVKP